MSEKLNENLKITFVGAWFDRLLMRPDTFDAMTMISPCESRVGDLTLTGLRRRVQTRVLACLVRGQSQVKVGGWYKF